MKPNGNRRPSVTERRSVVLSPFAMAIVGVFLLVQFSVLAGDDGVPWEPDHVRERFRNARASCNDVRDLLVLDNGFMAATGDGILHYEHVENGAELLAHYTVADGLPTSECHLLKTDSEGKIWAVCARGVACLAPGEVRWRAFVAGKELPNGTVTDLAFSNERTRVWVSTTRGLATTKVADVDWKQYSGPQIVKLFPHPSGDVVWCDVRVPHEHTMPQPGVAEFSLATGTWRMLPSVGFTGGVAYYSKATGKLWLRGAGGPPHLYDPRSQELQSWPRSPNWERVTPGHIVIYSDYFSLLPPWPGKKDSLWFATSAGFWEFRQKAGSWHDHRWIKKDPFGQFPLAVRGDDGRLLWACGDNVAAYEPDTGEWEHLWHVKEEPTGRGEETLSLSPDGRYLWWTGVTGVFVGDVNDRDAVILSDADAPGLNMARFVRFDMRRNITLIGTPRGIIGARHDGRLLWSLRQRAQPITAPVERLAFAPDASEVWCLMGGVVLRGPDRGRAAIYHPERGTWQELPDAGTQRALFDVVWLADGKRKWIAVRSDEEPDLGLLELSRGSTEWYPPTASLPAGLDTIRQFWLSPGGAELWMHSDGCGVVRLKIATGELSQYVKSEFRRHKIEAHFPLTSDYVEGFLFTNDGRRAVCAAGFGQECGLTVIDLATGEATARFVRPPTAEHGWGSQSYSIHALAASPDSQTVWCIVDGSELHALRLQNLKWIHRVKIPVSGAETLCLSPDGSAAWLRAPDGVAMTPTDRFEWKTWKGNDWFARETSFPPLSITRDGLTAVVGHARGIALLNRDGSFEIAEAGKAAGYSTTHIRPMPDSDDFLCALRHHHQE